MKRKVLCIFMSWLLIMEMVPVQSVSASGTLYYWYSDKYTIGSWNSTFIKLYKNKLNTNDSFFFLGGMDHAASQWNNALGIYVSPGATSYYYDSPIVYYGGTQDEILLYTNWMIGTSKNGYTETAVSYVDTLTYMSTSIIKYYVTGATGFIVDKGRTANQYKKTCTHELGHALGWNGHSGYNSDIMHGSGSSITTLTYRDKNHLSQVY